MAKQSTRKKTTKTEAAPQEDVLGDVSPQVLHGVTALRGQTNNLLTEVGRVEVHKDRLLKEIYRLDDEATRLLQEEAKRLEIPEGTPWRMTPEGKAMVVKE